MLRPTATEALDPIRDAAVTKHPEPLERELRTRPIPAEPLTPPISLRGNSHAGVDVEAFMLDCASFADGSFRRRLPDDGDFARELGRARLRSAKLEGKREYPLTYRHGGQNAIDQVRGGVGHAPPCAARAEAAELTGEGDEKIVTARIAVRAHEAVSEDTAAEIVAKLGFNVARERCAVALARMGEERLEVLAHERVEDRLRRAVGSIRGRECGHAVRRKRVACPPGDSTSSTSWAVSHWLGPDRASRAGQLRGRQARRRSIGSFIELAATLTPATSPAHPRSRRQVRENVDRSSPGRPGGLQNVNRATKEQPGRLQKRDPSTETQPRGLQKRDRSSLVQPWRCRRLDRFTLHEP